MLGIYPRFYVFFMCFTHHVHIILEIAGENFKLYIVERIISFLSENV